MNRSVLDLKIGQSGVVKSFADESLACKLLTVGIIPDSTISLIRKAPFGGAYCIRLGQTYIAVRTAEAASILIK